MKTKLFINTKVLACETDYILGGFYTDSDHLTQKDILSAIRRRIERIVREYVDDEDEGYKTRLRHGDEIEDSHGEELLQQRIMDVLKLRVESGGIDGAVKTIMNSDAMVNFIIKIKQRTQPDEDRAVATSGLIETHIEESEIADYWLDIPTCIDNTDNATLEHVLEALANTF